MSPQSTNEPAEKWIPHEQRWRACEGHLEREPGRLQLRVPLRRNEGVCTVLFEEDDESVAVLILVCGDDPCGGLTDCPVHIYLERPLGDRTVVDVVRAHHPVPYRNIYPQLERQFNPP